MRSVLAVAIPAAAISAAALSAAVLAALPAAAANRAGYLYEDAEQRIIPWSGAMPGCTDPSVLGRIQSRFAQKESEYWSSALTIVGFEKIRPVAVRPWGQDFVPRRFCSGIVTVSDGKKRRVDYAVGEDLGLLGVTWGVTWCVSGLDRNRAYGADCRAARP